MPVGTPFHERTFALCESLSYREWSGYYTVSSYETHHEHEYNAIRNAAALIDISPLFKYIITGPDAARLVDRVITRDVSRMDVGRVFYTPWCDEEGFVIDDGTVARLAETRFRMTAAEPTLRWLIQNARGFDVRVEDVSETDCRAGASGPAFGARPPHLCVGGYRPSADTSGSLPGRSTALPSTSPERDIPGIWATKSGSTPSAALRVWDAVMAAGHSVDIKPAGMLALDVARVEAGLVLADVDYVGSRKALTDPQKYTPYEMGLGRLVDPDKGSFVGKAALADERARGPRRRIIGLTVDWSEVEALYERYALPPVAPAAASRTAVPVITRWPPGRPCNDDRLVTDVETADCAGHRGCAPFRGRNHAADGDDD